MRSAKDASGRGCRTPAHSEPSSSHTTGSSKSIPVRQLSDEQLDTRLRHDAALRRAVRDLVPLPRQLDDARSEIAACRIERRRRRALAELDRIAGGAA